MKIKVIKRIPIDFGYTVMDYEYNGVSSIYENEAQFHIVQDEQQMTYLFDKKDVIKIEVRDEDPQI